jgi:hypothetical protein
MRSDVDFDRTIRPLPALAAFLVLAWVLAGCGGGSGDQAKTDKQDVGQVLSDLQAASRNGDGARICNQIFTPKLANSVTKSSSSGSCASEVRRNLFSRNTKITVENIDVRDTSNANATVKEANGNTSTVFLVKQSGRWRIRSVQPA